MTLKACVLLCTNALTVARVFQVYNVQLGALRAHMGLAVVLWVGLSVSVLDFVVHDTWSRRVAVRRATESYVVVVNTNQSVCATCGEVHLHLTRGCVPIAFPMEVLPPGLTTQRAEPPARVFADIEDRAMRYRLRISEADRPTALACGESRWSHPRLT